MSYIDDEVVRAATGFWPWELDDLAYEDDEKRKDIQRERKELKKKRKQEDRGRRQLGKREAY